MEKKRFLIAYLIYPDANIYFVQGDGSDKLEVLRRFANDFCSDGSVTSHGEEVHTFNNWEYNDIVSCLAQNDIAVSVYEDLR